MDPEEQEPIEAVEGYSATPAEQPEVDMEELAEKIYQIMLRELLIENDRTGR